MALFGLNEYEPISLRTSGRIAWVKAAQKEIGGLYIVNPNFMPNLKNWIYISHHADL
jgi:hypothetical protein